MFPNHLISAKVVILFSVGVLVGHAIGRSLASDAAQGRSLTMKEYIADFDAHKAKLTSSEIPMPAATAVERRFSPTPPPGPPA